jgi:flagellar biogenesis protein FliO
MGGGVRPAECQDGDMALTNSSIRASLVASAMLFAVISSATAQLVSTSERADLESRPLGAPAAPVGDSTVGANGNGDSGWVRTGLALGGVIGLVLLTRVALVRLSKRSGSLALSLGGGGRAPSGVLEVLGRYPVARGQTLVLLRMDRRILLLSQTSAGCSTLAEVTDADEVASLLLRTRDEEGATNAARFNELLHQMENDPSIIGAERGETADGGGLRAKLARFREVRA